MENLIKNAAKGRRKALEQLYENHKQSAYYLACCLLGQNGPVEEVTQAAFKNAWDSMVSSHITTEEEFAGLLNRRLVDYSRSYLLKSDSKAFRIPQNRNFLLSFERNSETDVLSALPPLHRFLFVLRTVGRYAPEQLADTFKIDLKTVRFASDAEKTNFERLALQKKQNFTLDTVTDDVIQGEKDAVVPEVLNQRIYDLIDRMASPNEKKQRTRGMVIGFSVLVVVLLIVGLVFSLKKDDTVTETETSETVSEETSSEETSSETADSSVITEPVIDLDEELTYYADIEIADYGTITVQLDQQTAPVTVANFVNLAQSGFYDGLTFHRIIEGFMMQGGDPNGNGTGGSENCIVGEFSENGYENNISHTRGTISMARSSDCDSASSQFFIMHEDYTSLDGSYAAFGHVTEGLEIVDAVCEAAEPTDDNGTISADEQPVITSITIRTE